jgi:hypothetical protein
MRCKTERKEIVRKTTLLIAVLLFAVTGCNVGGIIAPGTKSAAATSRPLPANPTSAILGNVKIEMTGPAKQTLMTGSGSYDPGYHGAKGFFLNFGGLSLTSLRIGLPVNAAPGTYTIVAQSASEPFATGSYRNDKGTMIRYDRGSGTVTITELGKTVSGNLDITLEAKDEAAITFKGSFSVSVSGSPS